MTGRAEDQRSGHRRVREGQEHTRELLVVRAVGACVFSQSNDKIFIPGMKQKEESWPEALCPPQIPPCTDREVQLWGSSLSSGPLPSHTKHTGHTPQRRRSELAQVNPQL